MSSKETKNLDKILDLFFNQEESRKFENYQIFSKFSSKIMPNWFRPMLEDTERNIFYQKMIHGKVQNKIVVDLGAGTGMWTMESLSQGAKFVYLVERNPILIKYLNHIFKGKPVKVIGKDIKDLSLADFDHGTPEVIVHEIFSTIAISEGVIPAFKKINSLFKDKISYIPQYFWMEAYVNKENPIEINENEKEILGSNAEIYYEVLYPSRIRSRGPDEKINFETAVLNELNFVDLASIDEDYHVSLKSFPLNLTPGMVHQVHLGFRFSAEKDQPCFDTNLVDSHWGGTVAEFYAPKGNSQNNKTFSFKLNDMNIDTFFVK